MVRFARDVALGAVSAAVACAAPARRLEPRRVLPTRVAPAAPPRQQQNAQKPDAAAGACLGTDSRRLEALQRKMDSRDAPRRAPSPSSASSSPRIAGAPSPGIASPSPTLESECHFEEALGELADVFCEAVLGGGARPVAVELAGVARLLVLPLERAGVCPQLAGTESPEDLLAPDGSKQFFACAALDRLAPVLAAAPQRALHALAANERVRRLCPRLVCAADAKSASLAGSQAPVGQCHACKGVPIDAVARLCSSESPLSRSAENAGDLANRDQMFDAFVELVRETERMRATGAIQRPVLESKVREFFVTVKPLAVNMPWFARLLVEEMQQRSLQEILDPAGVMGADDSARAAGQDKLRRLGFRIARGPHGILTHFDAFRQLFEAIVSQASHAIVVHVTSHLLLRIRELSCCICSHMVGERAFLLKLVSSMLSYTLYFPAFITPAGSDVAIVQQGQQFDLVSMVKRALERGSIFIEMPWISEFLRVAKRCPALRSLPPSET
eukprot:m51a1_g9555 hypothetical protein (502) ;mRNA; f:887070-888976